MDLSQILIRPICAEDEPLMTRFHATLSDRSVYLRYFHMLPLETRIAHERLARICSVDQDHELALVAESSDPATEEREILAVGRLVTTNRESEVEFAVIISDKNQGHGLGTEMVRRLVEIARSAKVSRVTADILGENRQMIEICRRLGFRLEYAGDGVVKAELEVFPAA